MKTLFEFAAILCRNYFRQVFFLNVIAFKKIDSFCDNNKNMTVLSFMLSDFNIVFTEFY